MRSPRRLVLITVAAMAIAAAAELAMGRLLLGPDGQFGWWEGNIWSQEQSQRVADPYSLTHVLHGLVFYALLWLAARRAPVGARYLGALAIETVWEIAENSPFIIDRYREATIALGYNGDSVLNSVSDIVMMSAGYWLAARLRPWHSAGLVVATELALLFWVRDNLTLNVVMLLYPIDAIRQWQMAAAP